MEIKTNSVAALAGLAQDLYKANQITKVQYHNAVSSLKNGKIQQTPEIISPYVLKARLIMFLKAISSSDQESNQPKLQSTKQQGLISIETIATNDSEHKFKTTTTLSQTDSHSEYKSSAFSNSVSQQLLDIDIEDFQLNLLELERSLYIPFTIKILSNTKYLAAQQIDSKKLNNFLLQVQRKYEKHDNPYHNYAHGMTVMHSCYILGKMSRAQSLLSDLDYFALVFSGLCHDVGHGGFNNDFQIKTQSKKALRWNDQSVLENYHVYTSMKMLLKHDNNFLERIKKEKFQKLRKMIIHNILATDMKEHHNVHSSFQNKISNGQIDIKCEQSVLSLTKFITHTSDLSGSVKKPSVALQWEKRINRQFAKQFREQELRGVSQTFFMKDLDVDMMAAAKNQKGFLTSFVEPLYKSMYDYSKNEIARKIMQNIETNISKVKERLSELEKKESEQAKKQRH